MHKEEATKTQSYLMRFVDLSFPHLPWKQVKWRSGVWAENEGENRAFSCTQSSFNKREENKAEDLDFVWSTLILIKLTSINPIPLR